MNKIKALYAQITPKTEAADLADKIINGECTANKTEKRRSRRFIGTAVCAAALVCGFTVSAVTIGWTYHLFGDTAEIIDSNIDKYKIEIGNVKADPANGSPYSFNVGDVISDGESIYINLFLDGLPADYSGYLSAYVVNSGDYDSSMFSSEWKLLDCSGNTALMINPENGVEKGNAFEIALETYPECKPVGNLSFDIQSDIIHMSKSINVKKEALLKNTYTVKHDPANPYGDLPNSIEYYVESIKISPLKYSVNGRFSNDGISEDAGRIFIAPDNFFLIYENGDKKPAGPDTTYGNDSDMNIKKHFDEVIDTDSIAAIQIGDLIVPIE